MCFKKGKEGKKEKERERGKHNVAGTCLNTLFWMRSSISFLRLYGHYPLKVSDLHTYTSGDGQSVLASKK